MPQDVIGPRAALDEIPNLSVATISITVLVLVQFGVVLRPFEALVAIGTFTVYSIPSRFVLEARKEDPPMLPDENGFAKYPLDFVSSIGKRGSKVSFTTLTECTLSAM